MNATGGLHAFAAFGIELEYMLVDRATLAVRPLADALLRDAAGQVVNEAARDGMAWSNELALHVLEIKNRAPDADLAALAGRFQAEVGAINDRLAPLGARLMPTATHPWMDPGRETRLWPHGHREIYQAYDRIFGCRGHGWANLQCMHLNLPFDGDAEFARLHAAIRLVLPILPALAASSPIQDGRFTGFMDSRMEAYRTHQIKVSQSIGRVIPDTVSSRREYAESVLNPLYRAIAPLDPDGVLRHEWLNVRGVIPRFERNALEIRVIDLQECPAADLAVATATVAVVQSLYDRDDLAQQQAITTGDLSDILQACLRDAELTVIRMPTYLHLLGLPGATVTAGEVWRQLVGSLLPSAATAQEAFWRDPLTTILRHGALSRRIQRAVGSDCRPERVMAVYGTLCDCLATGRMFLEVGG